MTTRRRTAFLLALTALLAFSARDAFAQMIVLGHDRHAASSVLVFESGDSDSDQRSETAPDLDAFDVAWTLDAYVPAASATARAEQSSEVTAESIRATGLAAGEADASEGGSAYASAESNLALRFTIDATRPFVLQGFLDGTSEATATIQLSRPFETIAWHSASGQRVTVNQQGTLEPGTYDLNVTCSTSASIGPLDDPVQTDAAYDVLFLLASSTAAPRAGVSAPALRASPNPFRAGTRLAVPDGVQALRVFDARGRLVRTLEASPAVAFDGRDAGGRALASGVYWVKAVGPAAVEPVKLLRLR